MYIRMNDFNRQPENQFSTVALKFVHHLLPVTGATAHSNAFFGRGSGGIFLDNVGCRGTESLLLNCTNRGIGIHSCQHSDDAGVICLGKLIQSILYLLSIYSFFMNMWRWNREGLITFLMYHVNMWNLRTLVDSLTPDTNWLGESYMLLQCIMHNVKEKPVY